MNSVRQPICVNPMYALPTFECGEPDVISRDVASILAILVGTAAFALMIILAGDKRSRENEDDE